MTYPPNYFLGSCLDEAWVEVMETDLGVVAGERRPDGRLLNPLLAPARKLPRYWVDDDRTASSSAYSARCLGENMSFFGARPNADGSSPNIAGSVVIDKSSWVTHALASAVFAILAQELVGYSVSMLVGGVESSITERMSSVRAGICTPTHVNIEVWETSILDYLEVYANETYSPGDVGYFGQSGLYTTSEFVVDGANASIYSPPFYADFWKDYVSNEALLNATSVSILKSDGNAYPPSENGCLDESGMGCRDACAKSEACTLREADGKECMVVIMMYDSYDRGYLQASMSNLGIPAYFCFLGYDGAMAYVIEAKQNSQPVVFYHYEPDVFHQAHPKQFKRVYLPQPLPEDVLANTGTYGELGYGNATMNPVTVDFPTTTLKKYAASKIDALPIGSFLSRFSISSLHIRALLTNYASLSADVTIPDPTFSSACQWIKANYNTWYKWIDPLPLCTLDEYMTYSISGCNDTTIARTIEFSWITPDPDNASLPYACDGGEMTLPAPIITSRSCEWLESFVRTWEVWIDSKPQCDSTFYTYTVSPCDSSATRTVHYVWLLESSSNLTLSAECEGGITLPSDVQIGCEYVPLDSPITSVIAALAGVLALVLVAALFFVYHYRNEPIIKRSQFELLELMIVGGFFIAGATIAYAGEPTEFLCGLRPILISLGFTTIFGSLVVKSLRVYRVFMRKTMKRSTVPLRSMIKALVVFYFVDFGIFVVWFSVDFPGPRIATLESREFPGEVDQITCSSSTFTFSALLVLWKAGLLFAGLYLSFLIRNVSVDFQESLWIFSSAVVVLFACLVIIPLAYLVNLTASSFYVFLAGMLLLCTSMVMALMLVPKLLRLHEAETSSKFSSSSSSTSYIEKKSGSFVGKLTSQSSQKLTSQTSSKYMVNPIRKTSTKPVIKG